MDCFLICYNMRENESSYLLIDCKKIKDNFRECERICNGKKICAVVKANAYGHGAVETSKLFVSLGASMLAVANINEAIELRNANIIVPILILGHTAVKDANLLVKYNLSQCIYSYFYAKALSDNLKVGANLSVHVKIDTGMHRLGFNYNDFDEIYSALELPKLNVEGIFTHLSSADSDKRFTHLQIARFEKLLVCLQDKNKEFKYIHAQNSAGLLGYNTPFNMVRLGIALYGISPINKFINNFSLGMDFITHITQIKKVNRLSRIGYNGKRNLVKKTIAVLPVGYADGLLRGYKRWLALNVNGYKCKVVGKICMDQMMIDVSKVKAVKVGDTVSMFRDKNALLSLSKGVKTIPYEIFCTLGKRQKRIYKNKINGR